MKVRILKDHDHALAPARVQAFKAGSVVNVPRATAEKLIEAGAGEAVPRAGMDASQED